MLALATSVPVSCSWPQPPTGRLWRVHLRRACVSRASGLCKLCPDTGAGGSCSDASDRAGGAGKSPRALSEVSEQRPVPRGFPSDPCRPSVAGGPGSPHRGGGHRPRLHTRATKVSFRFVFKPQPCGMSKGRVPLLGVGMGGQVTELWRLDPKVPAAVYTASALPVSGRPRSEHCRPRSPLDRGQWTREGCLGQRSGGGP